MKAVVIVAHGGIEGLEVREVSDPPPPSADRVQVRVQSAALNRADILQRLGRYPAQPGVPPDIPGLEFAGEVQQVGDEVRAWKKGQRVFGITGGGAQAEYVTVPESTLAEIPENLQWSEAAAVPEVFITAHDALFTQAELKLGERVLIHAAGSGVGTAAIQLAHAAGATVYGTSRTAEKLQKAKQLGLSESVEVGETPEKFAAAVRQWTSGAGVNVILDLVGGAYLKANLAALSPMGRLMLVGTTSGAQAELDISIVMGKRLRLTGTVLRARSTEEKARATRLFAAHVIPLLARGVVHPIIDSVYPVNEVRAAHARVESNESFGKVVLTIAD